MKPQNGAALHLAFVVGSLVYVVRLAEECQRRAVSTSRRFNDVRREAVAGLIVEIRQILAAAFVFRIAVRVELQGQRVGLLVQLALHVAAQVEVTSVSDTFQLAVLAGGEKRKRVFDVGCAR